MKSKIVVFVFCAVLLCVLTSVAAFGAEYTYEMDGVVCVYDEDARTFTFTGSGTVSTFCPNAPWDYLKTIIRRVVICKDVSFNDDDSGILWDYSILESVDVEEGHPLYSSVDGVLYDKSRKTLLCWPRGRSGMCVIPEGTERIQLRAFQNCPKLTGVYFPSSMKSAKAYYPVTREFTTFSIPGEKLEFFLEEFKNQSVKEVIVRDGCKEIPDGAFGDLYYKDSILRVELPDGITRIGQRAFKGCTKLESVVLPDCVAEIADEAFFSCKSLEMKSLPSALKTIGGYAFCVCGSLSYAELPEGLESIGTRAFANSGLRSVIIPDSVTEIGSDAFDSCDSLKSVHIGAGVHDVGWLLNFESSGIYTAIRQVSVSEDNGVLYSDAQGAVYNRNTKTLELLSPGFNGRYILPDDIETIEERAFMYCFGVTGIYLGKDVQRVDGISGAYYERRSWDNTVEQEPNVLNWKIDISENNTALMKDGTGSIYTADGKTLIKADMSVTGRYTVPEGVEKICSCAFAGCRKLASLVLPESVKYMGDYMFNYCEQDFEMTLPSTEPVQRFTFDCCAPSKLYFYGTVDEWTALRKQDYERGNFGLSKTKVYFNCVPPTGAVPFSDVRPGAFYADAVAWAVAGRITRGTGDLSFSPDGECTRAQVVTFLWRAAGSPGAYDFCSGICPFTDVADGTYYYRAAVWAAKNGITDGVGGGKFAPNSKCTRAQVVTFLWRAAGCPAPAVRSCAFTDVRTDSYYYKAMLWAVGSGVAKGVGVNRFKPDGFCTRGQTVTFLERADRLMTRAA